MLGGSTTPGARGPIAARLNVIRFYAKRAVEALQGLGEFAARHQHSAEIELRISRGGIRAHGARNQLLGILQSA